MTWEETLEAKATAEKQIKELCMIFQVEAKTRHAKYVNLPENTFYHLSFDKWVKLDRLITNYFNTALGSWTGSWTGECAATIGQICEQYKINNPISFRVLQDNVNELLMSEQSAHA